MARRWLVAAVLLLALGGCGDEPEAEPATVPVPATSSDTPVPGRAPVVAGQTAVTPASGATAAADAKSRTAAAGERKSRPGTPGEEKSRAGTAGFVAVVQRELPGVAVDHRDEEIAALAQQACAALTAGRSADAVVAGVRTFGTDRASARELVRLAVDTVCPDQDRRIDEF